MCQSGDINSFIQQRKYLLVVTIYYKYIPVSADTCTESPPNKTGIVLLCREKMFLMSDRLIIFLLKDTNTKKSKKELPLSLK